MTKADLKNGMVIETRNEIKGIVLNGKIIFESGFVNIYDLDENLECDFILSRDGYSIDKIYKHTVNCFDDLLNFERNMQLIWERKEDKQELSKKDKKVIKKGLKKVQELCREHPFCNGCELYKDKKCPCMFLDEFDMDKLFEE